MRARQSQPRLDTPAALHMCRCQACHEVCTGKPSIVSLLHVLMFKPQSQFDVLLPLDFFGFYFRFQFYSFSFGHSTTLASKIKIFEQL